MTHMHDNRIAFSRSISALTRGGEVKITHNGGLCVPFVCE